MNIFKASFAVRKAKAEISSARVGEIEEQFRLTTIATQFELAEGQTDPFFRLPEDFAALAECAAIWDVKAERATDKFHERTMAEVSVTRERVKFSMRLCELIQWD